MSRDALLPKRLLKILFNENAIYVCLFYSLLFVLTKSNHRLAHNFIPIINLILKIFKSMNFIIVLIQIIEF